MWSRLKEGPSSSQAEVHLPLEAFHDLRMFGCNIGLFAHVSRQVVEQGRIVFDDAGLGNIGKPGIGKWARPPMNLVLSGAVSSIHVKEGFAGRGLALEESR